MAFSLRARFVFPVDRPAIPNGVVTVEGERIVAVGARAEAGEVGDLGDVALLPGLVNCHTHLEFSYLRRPLGSPGMRLVDWIRLVIAERGRGDDSSSSAIAAGMRESSQYGVTSIGDISLTEVGVYGASQAQLDIFSEVIGFSIARAESAFTALTQRLAMHDIVRRGVLDDIRLGVSPHAPYTVSPRLLERLVGLAHDRNMPIAMHLAESPEELELLEAGTGPFQELLEERSMWDGAAIPRDSRPMHYLRILAEAPRALVIHGNYLAGDEHDFLAANNNRMSLVYCPRTHAYFQHPPYPLADLIKKNVRVALGTDSRASNPDLSLLAEMRHVVAEFPAIDPHVVLRMGTLAGAEALGRDGEVGSITPGKLANLVAVPIDERLTADVDEILSAIFASDAMPSRVWSRGLELSG